MEQLTISNNLQLMYVPARSFPEGIIDAFNILKGKLPDGDKRVYYGVSWPIDGIIMYKAATETAFAGEAEKYDLQTYTVKAGKYIAIRINDWMKDETSIGKAFSQLLDDPRIDHNGGTCVEKYIGKDVVCMVRLAD